MKVEVETPEGWEEDKSREVVSSGALRTSPGDVWGEKTVGYFVKSYTPIKRKQSRTEELINEIMDIHLGQGPDCGFKQMEELQQIIKDKGI